jgi:PAS domain-containing protein
MTFRLPPGHRLAQINYGPRAVSFAWVFTVVCTLFAERGYSGWDLAFAVLTLLVYTHAVYVHTRMAPDSKQAELNNLYLDAILMGAWAAQMHFAFAPTVMTATAVTLNNAANGGTRRLVWGSLCFAGAAALWGAVSGFRLDLNVGPAVRVLSSLGMFAYVAWVGTIVYVENKVLGRMHVRQQDAERQFYFLAENPAETVSVLDPQGRFLYASPSHAKYFDAGVLGAGALWLGLVHPDDHERARDFLEKVVATHTRRRVRVRVVPREGPPRYVECVGSPSKDHRDNVASVVLVTQRLDVSAVAPEGG